MSPTFQLATLSGYHIVQQDNLTLISLKKNLESQFFLTFCIRWVNTNLRMDEIYPMLHYWPLLLQQIYPVAYCHYLVFLCIAQCSFHQVPCDYCIILENWSRYYVRLLLFPHCHTGLQLYVVWWHAYFDHVSWTEADLLVAYPGMKKAVTQPRAQV